MENASSDQAPRLINGRWRIVELVHLTYLEPAVFIVDVGPMDHDPTDAEIDQAFDYLSKQKLPWLELEESEWSLDLGALARASLSGLPADSLQGRLTHEPAFQVARSDTAPGQKIFLRIRFEKETAQTPESSSEISDAAEEVEDLSEAPTLPVEQEVDSPEEVMAPATRDPSLTYFQSPLSPEMCKQKLGNFVRSDPVSFLHAYAGPASEFTVKLREDGSFEVERSVPNTGPYGVVFCGILQADGEGTAAVGRFNVVDRNLFVSMMPYLVFIAAFLSGILGMRWTNDDAASISLKNQGMVCVIAALALLYTAFRAFQGANLARTAILNKESHSLSEFIQKTLEAKSDQ